MLNKPTPTILTFGWLGCQERHIRRIQSIYRNLNVDNSWMIQSPMSIIGVNTNTRDFERIRDNSIGKPVICHVFSLNGASSMIQSLADKNYEFFKDIDLRGIIWDSSPGTVYREMYHQAFAKAIFPRNKNLEKIASVVLDPLFDIFLVFSKSHEKKSQDMINSLYTNPPKCRQLVLGSNSDKIVLPHTTKLYVNTLQEKGINVKSKFWDDSAHVRMFIDHQEEYSKLVSDFVGSCVL